MREIKVLIVGGCFTQQSNIENSKLYHQIIKEKLAKRDDINMSIKVVRYERLSRCFNKIANACETGKPDCIIFHVRAEPVLRVTKFYYKYKDLHGQLIRRLNLLILKINNPEKHRHFIHTDYDYTPGNNKDSMLHYFLRETNYILGCLAGNLSSALASYLNLIKEVNQLCHLKNINLIIIGPVSRPHTFMENLISSRINDKIEPHKFLYNLVFVKCLGFYSDNKQRLFSEGGILVNEAGHKRIADLIYNSIKANYIPSQN